MTPKNEIQKCDKCDFKSGSKAVLNRHKISDHKITCAECDYTCSSKALLNRHNESAHDLNNSQKSQDMRRRYNCEKCSFITTSETSLTNHRETKHKLKVVKASKRKTCDICNKKFNKDSTFNIHIKKEQKQICQCLPSSKL